MGRALRALIVEDFEPDAVLLVRELKRGGFDVTHQRVDTEESMSAALDGEPWDIVISDYAMPRFSAPHAIALVRRRGLDTPVIIVSGTVDEETAVDAMRAGAQDFMAKGHFARMIPAIERELRDAASRAERSRMQRQLLISDRMASVGTLAAGVAHEINNPLAALITNLDWVAEDVVRLAQEARTQASYDALIEWLATRLREIEEPLRDARDSAERVRLIVRDLKTFSRSDEETRGPVDVRRVMESSVRMAWNEIRHRAQLVKDYGDVPPVEGNEGRLGQVFLNLVVNAAQAIPDGRAGENEIRILTRQDGDRVVVEVRDTGNGIPAAALPRDLDPFFTTKPVGTGTGLGLAICHRIVSELGGTIQVESEIDKGSVFRVFLGVAAPEPAEPPHADSAVPPSMRGRILIVDDERTIGAAIRRILRDEHEVFVVTRAQAALELLARGDRFDVILCDLMMPEMTGMEFHAELLRITPELAARVAFMTGGAFTSEAREFLRDAPNRRIEKPFDAASLRALVQVLLL